MSDVQELNINNSTYDIKAKSVVDTNSGKVKMWTGTKAQYDAIVTKDADTLYNVTDDTEDPTKVRCRSIGEIVTSTIPIVDAGLHLLDGALLNGSGSYGDFVDYIAELYSRTPTVYLPNVNIFGNLTDNDGVLSGFNTTSYAQIKQQLPLASANSFDFVFKFTYSPISTYQAIFSENNVGYFSFIGTDANGKLYCQLSNNHTSNNIGDGTGSTTLTSGSTYYVKLSFNGSSYTVYLSNTGAFSGEETTEITITSSLKLINYKWDIGGAALLGYEFPFQGSIDLADCYIDIDGNRWWSGLTSASLFTTESDWQSTVTQYGVCGKFVYDSVNNTVRLPKITGIIEGTTDASALGGLVEAGLPNIEGKTGLNSGASLSNAVNGVIYSDDISAYGYDGSSAATRSYNLYFDASRSSSIYGNSQTVQPQTIKALYYIVIANSTKTEIQVDIDEIATDLNGKADVDLSNINASQSAKETIIGWGMPDYTAGVDISSYTSSSNQYIVPCDGIIYADFDTGSNGGVYIDNIRMSGGNGYSNTSCPSTALISKNSTVYISSPDTRYAGCHFYPLKGVN